jgi:tetratricopeptide (TPR) repeat protein
MMGPQNQLQDCVVDMPPNEDEIANKCWRAGSEALNKENFDYAVEMFGQSVKLKPHNLVYRQSLRGAEFKKYKDNKKGGGMWAKSGLMSIRGKVSKLKGQKSWDEMDKVAEEGLLLNPWDAYLNFELGEACRERGFGEIAVFQYNLAVSPDGDPKNRAYLVTLSDLYRERNEFDLAVTIWRKIQSLSPDEMEARGMIMKLQAEKTIVKGRFEEASSTKDVTMSDQDVSERIKRGDKKADEAEAPGESFEADLKRAIRKDPENRDLHMKLGDYFRKENRLNEAIDAYKVADGLAGGNMNIREQIEDVELLIIKKSAEEAETKSKQEPENKDAKRSFIELGNKLLHREIEIYQVRVGRYPQNMKLKLELARRYRKVKNWSLAIPLLQQAATDQRMEVDALVMLGKCFLQDDKGTMALRQFKKVVGKLNFNDQPDSFKEVHYYMGRLYEQMNENNLAVDHYSEVLAVAYDYRDVRPRLEKLEGENPPSGSASDIPTQKGS